MQSDTIERRTVVIYVRTTRHVCIRSWVKADIGNSLCGSCSDASSAWLHIWRANLCLHYQLLISLLILASKPIIYFRSACFHEKSYKITAAVSMLGLHSKDLADIVNHIWFHHYECLNELWPSVLVPSWVYLVEQWWVSNTSHITYLKLYAIMCTGSVKATVLLVNPKPLRFWYAPWHTAKAISEELNAWGSTHICVMI